MTLLPTRRIGNTALEVSTFGMGGAPLGNLFAPIVEADAQAAVQSAWDGGVRFFDTAPHYGQGLSEQRFGRALRPMPRDDFVFATKVGRIMTPDANAPREINNFVDGLKCKPHFDYSHDGAMRSIADSLERLQLSRIDIVFIHDIDLDTHPNDHARQFKTAMDGAYRALMDLRAQGVIQAVGLGVNDWRVCCDAMRHGDFDCFLLAGRYTLLDQSALPELMPLCLARDTSVIVGGPYNSGVLAPAPLAAAHNASTFDYRPASPEILARVASLRSVAQAFGIPLAAAALQFPFGHPAVVSVIPGARSAAEVQANLRLAAIPIPAAYWHELKVQGLVASEAPLPTRPSPE